MATDSQHPSCCIAKGPPGPNEKAPVPPGAQHLFYGCRAAKNHRTLGIPKAPSFGGPPEPCTLERWQDVNPSQDIQNPWKRQIPFV